VRKVFVAQHPAEAHLIAGLLDSHGIAAVVRGEALFGARGEAPVTADTLPSVWVLDDAQVQDALALLEPASPSLASAEGLWQCLHCREGIEPQFTACWRCGADRPGSMSLL